MLAPKADVGSWVSEAAREKFMAAYERVFALWPQPVEEFDIETATATTRVHAYRPHPGGAVGLDRLQVILFFRQKSVELDFLLRQAVITQRESDASDEDNQQREHLSGECGTIP